VGLGVGVGIGVGIGSGVGVGIGVGVATGVGVEARPEVITDWVEFVQENVKRITNASSAKDLEHIS
tara:strand:- start:339 stop:536 length:198 start_codon:yes stop_codon:yes gene_type:complete